LKSLFGTGVRLYLGLGRYDFIVTEQRNDLSIIDKYRRNRFSNVLDWQTICGTLWKSNDNQNAIPNEKPVLGICCIKLDPTEVSCDSVTRFEERIVQKIAGLGHQVYCSLGNYEILAPVQCDDFNDLSNEVRKIKEVLVENGKAVLLDMTTIPGFDPQILSQNGPNDFNQNQYLFDLMISLRLGYSTELSRHIKTLFKNPKISNVYGFHDIWLHTHSTFVDFFDGLVKLRKQSLKLGIYSTYTSIEQFQKPLDFSPPSSFVSRPIVSLETNRKEGLSHFFHLLDISKSDVLTRNSFRNHIGFFREVDRLTNRCLRLKNKKKMIEYWGFVEKYDTVSDCMKLVFSQRCAGVLPGNLLSYKTIGLEPHGGIQRAILAVESIPIWLFQKLGIKWEAFCLFGYSHRFYRTECGMINVPEAYRIHPEMWWGLYHELGHETLERLSDIKITSFAQRSIDRLAQKAFKTSKNEGRDITLKSIIYDYTDFVQEIFAELFGFYFGFRNNWSLYKDKVWTYFAEEFPINERHIARSVLTSFTLGPGGKSRIGGSVGPDEIVKCIDELEKVFTNRGRKIWTQKERDDAEDLVVNFIPVADKFENYLARFHMKPLKSSEIRKINSSLREGKILHDSNPTEIIYALTNCKDRITLEQRVAAIVTLYGAYWNLMNGRN
jgi:hypothetical protein